MCDHTMWFFREYCTIKAFVFIYLNYRSLVTLQFNPILKHEWSIAFIFDSFAHGSLELLDRVTDCLCFAILLERNLLLLYFLPLTQLSIQWSFRVIISPTFHIGFVYWQFILFICSWAHVLLLIFFTSVKVIFHSKSTHEVRVLLLLFSKQKHL